LRFSLFSWEISIFSGLKTSFIINQLIKEKFNLFLFPINDILLMIYKEFLIRPAKNEDMASIKNIVFGILQEYGLKPNENGKDNDLNNIEQNYFSNNGYFGVAVERTSNNIVGTFGLHPINKNICELRKMYLLRHVRGKGLGKYMLNFAIEFAREKHYSKIFLETISPLKEAISLYKKIGFTEVKPLEINDRVDRAFELNIDGNGVL
jgi:putative acetyltransferase